MKKEFGIGILFASVALFFGISSLQYEIGSWDELGPGLYPLTVSAVLMTIAVISTLTGLKHSSELVSFSIKNIVLVIVSLVSFALLTSHVSIVAGTVALIAIASVAGERSSVTSIIMTASLLIAILYALKYFLNMSLPI
jgi:hypothetical protein